MLNLLGQVLPSAARRFGDKIALVIEGRSFSFRELDELSNALAASLVKLGVRPGDRVTLYAPNSWEWIVSYYGALKTGAVINPVNVMLTPAEVAYVTKDCGAKVLNRQPGKDRARSGGRRNRTAYHRVRQHSRSKHDGVQRARSRADLFSRPSRSTRTRFRRSVILPAPPAILKAPCSRIVRSCSTRP